MQPLFAIALAVLPLATLAGGASAAPLRCTCQQVTLCGADQCDPSPIETCPSTDIGLSLSEPAIRLCVFSDCLEGPAQRTDISETLVVLEGHYSPTHEPQSFPAHVVSMLDLETGIGLVQSSDEQAVAQYAIICESQD